MELNVLEPLTGLLKLDRVRIDNWVSFLHHKLTFLLLLAFAALLTSELYYHPLDCYKDDKDTSREYINNYCWVNFTFSIKAALNMTVGGEVLYPGIDTTTPGSTVIHLKYYQWVPLVLAIQAFMFTLPRRFWAWWEDGDVSSLVATLDDSNLDREERDGRVEKMLRYFQDNLGHHNGYFLGFLFSEVLSLVNVLFQAFLMDAFLGGGGGGGRGSSFLTYGLDVIRFNMVATNQQTNPMVVLFPRLAKCTYHSVSEVASPANDDILCLLPLNLYHQYFYLFLWFWLVFLVVASGCTLLLYRLPLLFSAPLRKKVFLFWTDCRDCDPGHLDVVFTACHISDWFIIYRIAQNMNSENFALFIQRYSERLLSEPSAEQQQQTE